MPCKLFLKNNKQSKQRNLQLLKFLTNNVEELIKNGFVFEIIKVTKNNSAELKQNGVPATPALLLQSGPVIGTTAIIQFLIQECERPPGSKKARKKTSHKDAPAEESEEVKDLLMDIIQSYNEEDDDEDPETIKKKMNDDMRRRSTVESTEAPQISTNEDDAMSKYWDNLEETEI